MNEFFKVSNCKTVIWDTLEITRGFMEEIKISTLKFSSSLEYKIFRMFPREMILNIQKRFIHLRNHLVVLEKNLQIMN